MNVVVPKAGQPGAPGVDGKTTLVPVFAAQSFVVSAHMQALFSEPITLGQGAWIEVQQGAILKEVR